jgi:hypothetical protein
MALLGYIAGASWKQVARYATQVGIALFVIVVLTLILGHLLRTAGDSQRPSPAAMAVTVRRECAIGCIEMPNVSPGQPDRFRIRVTPKSVQTASPSRSRMAVGRAHGHAECCQRASWRRRCQPGRQPTARCGSLCPRSGVTRGSDDQVLPWPAGDARLQMSRPATCVCQVAYRFPAAPTPISRPVQRVSQ